MSSAAEQYEALADDWEAAGFHTPEDPSFGQVSRMYLWIHSDGAKRQGVSERLRQYVGALQATLEKKYPGWYDAQFDDHDSCKICGERYRWENLSMCTQCSAAICPSHRASGGHAPNGNYQCPACGAGEIVG